MLRVTSVNVGRARLIPGAESVGPSGIYKLPQHHAVAVTAQGLEGDAICHTEDHGGPDQAVYAYGGIDYRWWATELQRPVEPGTFGENLTINGMSSDLHVGDRLHVGSVTLEATGPRIPCANFSARMQDRRFAKRFRDAARPGVYFRVLQPGTVSADDAVELVASNRSDPVGVVELFHAYYDAFPEAANLRRLLAAPIAARLRARLQKQLDALE